MKNINELLGISSVPVDQIDSYNRLKSDYEALSSMANDTQFQAQKSKVLQALLDTLDKTGGSDKNEKIVEITRYITNLQFGNYSSNRRESYSAQNSSEDGHGSSLSDE